MSSTLEVRDGQVVSMEYTLRVEGEVKDSSKGGDPLMFLVGAGNIIPGLENEMIGMKVGESKKVVVAPADGYGELNEDATMLVPRDQFPGNIPMEAGIELQVRDQSGSPRYARIERVEEDRVTLNLNHPLAGMELHFEVKVVDLRDATPEEKEHKHVHQGGHHH